MMNAENEKFLCASDVSVQEAMRRIDANACGILMLKDAEGHLVGAVTDGDIRRFLLAGGKLEEGVSRAANRSPRSAQSMEEARALYHKRNYVAIPVLDGEGRIVDLYFGKRGEKPCAALHIPVVINAGGKGTRLDPYTRVLPKPLIPVGELPIIEHIMRQFIAYSCRQFHVIVNYKKRLMKAYFSESDERYDVTWYDEEQPLGTGGGLSLLKGWQKGAFFFTNCDTLLQTNYESLLKFHRENANVITMVCAHKNVSIPYGVVEMGQNGRIEAMREKPHLSFLTNTGMYIVEPEVLDDIEDGVAVGFPDVVERQRQKGRKVAVYPVGESEWMDMGQLPELEKMRQRLCGV